MVLLYVLKLFNNISTEEIKSYSFERMNVKDLFYFSTVFICHLHSGDVLFVPRWQFLHFFRTAFHFFKGRHKRSQLHARINLDRKTKRETKTTKRMRMFSDVYGWNVSRCKTASVFNEGGTFKSPLCTGFTLRAARVQANLESSERCHRVHGCWKVRGQGFWLAKKALVWAQVGLMQSGQRRESWREHGLLDFRWDWTRSASAWERHLVRTLHRQHPTPSVWRMVSKVRRNMMHASKMHWFNRENNTRMHCNKLRKNSRWLN